MVATPEEPVEITVERCDPIDPDARTLIAALGRDRLVLETGTRQLAAIRLYEREGFVPAPAFGDDVASEHNTFFAKALAPADSASTVRSGRLAGHEAR